MRFSTIFLLLFSFAASAQQKPSHNLVFDTLATRWDDGMPLGNGVLGALVWQKAGMLHLSLDRADLWDERQALDLDKFNFNWVKQQVEKKAYDTVQKLGDEPYEASPYPTKIPAGALEFDISSFGRVVSNELDISNALNTIKFESKVVCYIYVHASKQAGYFGFENLPGAAILPQLIIPGYHNGSAGGNGNSVEGLGLQKLGYAKGWVNRNGNSLVYHQPISAGGYYEIYVTWKKVSSNHVIGGWTITVNHPAKTISLLAAIGEPTGWSSHLAWWNKFWKRSGVSIPDAQLEKQYYLEMYKLGSVARKGAPACTLQAIWTADNGNLPPWKGDFHNDLNTQLSYWPSYSSNHLNEAATYTDWLWSIRDVNKKYTKKYFGVDGLNVPGVTTLHGYPMGGWIQYSLSPTIGAWVAQHFYWQWRYSMDKDFLVNKAYPYIHDVAVYLEQMTNVKSGKRKLPLSSSPEYNDNSIHAWFSSWTNYDLSLAKFLFSAARATSDAVGKKDEAKHWAKVSAELPGYNTNETGLTVAEGQDLDVSHRHLSPYMAIYPLCLLDMGDEKDREIINRSLHHIEQKGTGEWCGYSFSWMAAMYAYAGKADSAARMLQLFASRFCGINSFHLNGDQGGGQYSHFTYRPFTLEGNFAFAQGLQEMLLQSQGGYIDILPATPESWKDIAFSNLRTEGAFLVSVQKKAGVVETVSVYATHDGEMRIRLPFKTFRNLDSKVKYKLRENIFSKTMKKGEQLVFRNVIK